MLPEGTVAIGEISSRENKKRRCQCSVAVLCHTRKTHFVSLCRLDYKYIVSRFNVLLLPVTNQGSKYKKRL